MKCWDWLETTPPVNLTLMKVLSGAYIPDEGEIFIEGSKVNITSPMRARQLGIEMVYQESGPGR